MIFSVVPPELGDDVYKRLVEHYRENPNISVIVDRRRGERRADNGAVGAKGEKRSQRDRRTHARGGKAGV